MKKIGAFITIGIIIFTFFWYNGINSYENIVTEELNHVDLSTEEAIKAAKDFDVEFKNDASYETFDKFTIKVKRTKTPFVYQRDTINRKKILRWVW